MSAGAVVDGNRMAGLISLGIETHPDPERVTRFIRAGAAFLVRHHHGDVQVRMAFTENSPGLAAMRSAIWGHDVEEPRPEDVGEFLELIQVPAGTLTPKPQG